MTDETKALVERLRDIAKSEQRAGIHGRHAELLRQAADAIAVLSRPLPGVVEGCEPSDDATKAVIDGYADTFKTLAGFEDPEHCMKEALQRAYAIDLAPRVAAGYARGVKDAAEMVDNNDDEGSGFGSYIRKILLPKEPETDDARDKERDADLDAAHCIKYHQQRELDK